MQNNEHGEPDALKQARELDLEMKRRHLAAKIHQLARETGTAMPPQEEQVEMLQEMRKDRDELYENMRRTFTEAVRDEIKVTPVKPLEIVDPPENIKWITADDMTRARDLWGHINVTPDPQMTFTGWPDAPKAHTTKPDPGPRNVPPRLKNQEDRRPGQQPVVEEGPRIYVCPDCGSSVNMYTQYSGWKLVKVDPQDGYEGKELDGEITDEDEVEYRCGSHDCNWTGEYDWKEDMDEKRDQGPQETEGAGITFWTNF